MRICLVLHGFAEQKIVKTEHADTGSQPSHCVSGVIRTNASASTIAATCQGRSDMEEFELPMHSCD